MHCLIYRKTRGQIWKSFNDLKNLALPLLYYFLLRSSGIILANQPQLIVRIDPEPPMSKFLLIFFALLLSSCGDDKPANKKNTPAPTKDPITEVECLAQGKKFIGGKCEAKPTQTAGKTQEECDREDPGSVLVGFECRRKSSTNTGTDPIRNQADCDNRYSDRIFNRINGTCDKKPPANSSSFPDTTTSTGTSARNVQEVLRILDKAADDLEGIQTSNTGIRTDITKNVANLNRSRRNLESDPPKTSESKGLTCALFATINLSLSINIPLMKIRSPGETAAINTYRRVHDDLVKIRAPGAYCDTNQFQN